MTKSNLFIFIILLFVLLIFSNNLLAQTPIYDAIQLSEWYSKFSGDWKKDSTYYYKIYRKLAIYTNDSVLRDRDLLDFNTIKNIKDHFNNNKNKFISNFLEEVYEKAAPKKRIQGILPEYVVDENKFATREISLSPSQSSSPAGIGIKTADALAKLLIKRAKQELAVAFFEKLQEKLNNKKDEETYKELRILFPTTLNFLNQIKTYNYSSMLQVLREAFENDLKNLLVNIPVLASKKDNPELRYLAVISYIISSVSKEVHPAEIIGKLANEPYIKNDTFDGSKSLNFSSALKLLSLVSNSLRDTGSADNGWVKQNTFLKFKQDKRAKTLFIGLLYQQGSNIIFKNPDAISFQALLNKLNDKGEIKRFNNYLQTIFTLVDSMDNYVDGIRQKKEKDENLSFSDYQKFLNYIIEWLGNGLRRENIADFPNEIIPTRYIFFANSSIEIYKNIKEKHYSSAIVNTVILMDSTLSDNFKNKEDFLKYGAFMAAVVQAENSDEVEKAIEAIVLPSGSASIKRNSTINIALNAYVGLFGGSETLIEVKNDRSFSGGLTAPVGIALSFGKLCIGGSFTVFTSIVDLAALVNFRTKESGDENLPEFKLKNLFAPGAHLVYGIRKTPISVGLGIQSGPQLRKITVNNVEIESSAWRWGGFIAVDIPLLDFYTK